MSIKGITENFIWIQTLFIRDDGVRFLLGGGDYPFTESQLHFNGEVIANDVIELQGTDGQLLAGQVRRSATQQWDGYIGSASDAPLRTSSGTLLTTEQLRTNFLNFFEVRHHYTVVYVDKNGVAIQSRVGYLVDAPEVKEIIQMSPQYHVAMNFEDPNYYSYDEDENGNEIYGNTYILQPYQTGIGGVVWDNSAESGVTTDGAQWSDTADEEGLVWERGGSGINYVDNSGARAYPIITISGAVQDPVIENLTTGDRIAYSGTISANQTLTLDAENQTATLDGLNVFDKISGNFITLATGRNNIQYLATAPSDSNLAVMKWRVVVA